MLWRRRSVWSTGGWQVSLEGCRPVIRSVTSWVSVVLSPPRRELRGSSSPKLSVISSLSVVFQPCYILLRHILTSLHFCRLWLALLKHPVCALGTGCVASHDTRCVTLWLRTRCSHGQRSFRAFVFCKLLALKMHF